MDDAPYTEIPHAFLEASSHALRDGMSALSSVSSDALKIGDCRVSANGESLVIKNAGGTCYFKFTDTFQVQCDDGTVFPVNDGFNVLMEHLNYARDKFGMGLNSQLAQQIGDFCNIARFPRSEETAADKMRFALQDCTPEEHEDLGLFAWSAARNNSTSYFRGGTFSVTRECLQVHAWLRSAPLALVVSFGDTTEVHAENEQGRIPWSFSKMKMAGELDRLRENAIDCIIDSGGPDARDVMERYALFLPEPWVANPADGKARSPRIVS